jgi:archaetidylinositol phosphate synthase
MMESDLRRTNSGWLSAPEQRALKWLAPRVPASITPDQLTLLGFLGAVLALLGYAISPHSPMAFWLVNLALIINWLGDSLDGAVARQRGISRHRYGFFLDQSVDVLSQAIFALGLGISGVVRPEIVAIGFAAYLMMTVQSLLYAQATGVFHLATAGIGLTEIRCLFFIANASFYFWTPVPFDLVGIKLAYSDLLGLLWSGVNICLFVMGMYSSLRKLANIDRPPPCSSREIT